MAVCFYLVTSPLTKTVVFNNTAQKFKKSSKHLEIPDFRRDDMKRVA